MSRSRSPEDLPPHAGALREFWEGATRPSAAALVGILVLLVVQFAVLCWLCTPRRLASLDPGWIMSDPQDLGALVTIEAHRLGQRPHAGMGVVITGGSAIREAIHSEAELATALSQRLGEPVQLHLLASPLQPLRDSVALAEQVPDDFRGVVLMAVSPYALSNSKESLARRSQYIAADSASLRSVIIEAGLDPPRHTGIFLVDHALFFALRVQAMGSRLAVGPPDGFAAEGRLIGEPPTEADWRVFRRVQRRRLGRLEQTAEWNLRLLGAALERLRRHPRIRVALLAPTNHPRVPRMLGEGFERYREELSAFASREGVVLWSLDHEAGLVAADFHDWIHLGRAEARRRYQEVVAVHLEPLLRDVREGGAG